MAFLDRFRSNKIRITAVETEKETKQSGINEKLEIESIQRIKESLSDYANAIIDAESEHLSSALKYKNLFNLYKNLELDEHISAVSDSILYDITQTEFVVTDVNGEIDEDKKRLFEAQWFTDFVRYYLKAKYYPFGLIHFTGIKNNTFAGVEWVNEYHLRTESNGIAKYDFEEETFLQWDKKPLSDWTLFVKSDKHLGLYATIAKRFILKRDINQYWAVFNELFTTPYYIVKTDFNNAAHRNNLLNFLTNRKHSGFGIISHEDEISQLLTYTGTGWQSYQAFEDAQNKAISKAFLGQTMTTEDGSSRSQAEVHQETKNAFVNARLKEIEYCINGTIIPMMQANGIGVEFGDSFSFKKEKDMTPLQWSEVLRNLSGYKVSDDDIIDKIGVEVEEVQLPAMGENKFQAIYKELKAKHNGI